MASSKNKLINHPYGLVHRWDGDQLWFYWTEFTEGHIMAMDNTTQEVRDCHIILEASVFFTNDMLFRKATRALAASSLICMRPIRPLLLDGHHPDICHPGTCHPTFKKPHPK